MKYFTLICFVEKNDRLDSRRFNWKAIFQERLSGLGLDKQMDVYTVEIFETEHMTDNYGTLIIRKVTIDINRLALEVKKNALGDLGDLLAKIALSFLYVRPDVGWAAYATARPLMAFAELREEGKAPTFDDAFNLFKKNYDLDYGEALEIFAAYSKASALPPVIYLLVIDEDRCRGHLKEALNIVEFCKVVKLDCDESVKRLGADFARECGSSGVIVGDKHP